LFVIHETGSAPGSTSCSLAIVGAHRARLGALVFRSLEAFALDAAALERALGRWPELAPFTRQLLAAWPPLLRPAHAGIRRRPRELQLYIATCARHWHSTAPTRIRAGPKPTRVPGRLRAGANPRCGRRGDAARGGAQQAGHHAGTFTVAARCAPRSPAGLHARPVPGFGASGHADRRVRRRGGPEPQPPTETPGTSRPPRGGANARDRDRRRSRAPPARALARRGWRDVLERTRPRGRPRGIRRACCSRSCRPPTATRRVHAAQLPACAALLRAAVRRQQRRLLAVRAAAAARSAGRRRARAPQERSPRTRAWCASSTPPRPPARWRAARARRAPPARQRWIVPPAACVRALDHP